MTTQTREDVKAAIKQLGDRIPAKYQSILEDAITRMYEQNLTGKEALNISSEMMELIYAQGYQFFKSGKYKDALHMFAFLRSLEIESYRYNFALAACYHYLKEYENAIGNYLLASEIELHNPIPHFHMYECFMRLNQPLPALKELITVVIVSDQQPRFMELKEKAALELERLKKELKNSPLNKEEGL